MDNQMSEDIFSRFFENSLDILCILDIKGLLKKCNTAFEKELGHNSSELIGLSFKDFVRNDDVEVFVVGFNKAINNEKVKNVIIRNLHKDGFYKRFGWSFFRDGEEIFASAHNVKMSKHAEEELLQYKKELTDSPKISNLGSWEYLIDKNKLIWNEQTFKIYGLEYNSIEPNFDISFKLIHPDDRDFVEEQYRKTIQTGIFNNYEYRIIHSDNSIHNIRIQGEVEYKNNKAYRTYGIIQDITGQKRDEERLKVFKSSVDLSNNAVFWINKDAGIEYVNQQAYKSLGYTYEELISLKVFDIYPSYLKEMWDEFWEESSKQEEGIIGYRFETIHKRKNGGIFPVEIELSHLWVGKKELQVLYARDISERKKSEEILKMFKKSVDLSNDAVYWLNKDAGFEYINEKAYNLLGYTKEEMMALTIFDIDPIYTRETWEQLLKEFHAHRNEGVYWAQFETWQKRKDGTIFPVEVVSSQLMLDGKEFHVAHVRDITERKQNEEYLRMFKTSIDFADDSVFWINKEGNFDYVNEKAWKSLGYTKEELMKMKIADIDPSASKEMWENRWESFQANKKDGNASLRIETSHIRKDGSIFPVEVLSNHHWLGKKEFHSSYSRDISERKESEETLLKNQKLLAETQRIANIGSWELDLATENLIWSEQTHKIFGVPDYDIPKKLDFFFRFVHKDDLARMKKVFRKSLELNEFINSEFRVVRTDKKIINVLIEGEFTFDKDKRPKQMLGSVQDITLQKLAELEIRKLNTELEARVVERTAQLHKANKELEAFAYSVSHDLRAPLRHIDGFLRLLYSSIDEPAEKTAGHYKKILSASTRMSEMIDGLLKFSRFGRASLVLKSVNLSQIINDLVEQLKPDYAERDIIWDIKDLPVVEGDVVLLRSAFENLLSNAIKYTSKKEQAIIEVGQETKQSDIACVYVKDNGAGFDMAYREKLFGVFQRLHAESEFTGIGIGLANVRQIVSKHNGTIDAVSEINKGATFYITLPLLK